MKLYIANKNYSSWSLRPWVLLRMLELSFEEVLVPFEGSGPQPAFHSFSPTGKVPCLVLDGMTVWDSLAIAETVAERAPAAWPADAGARAWARSASAEMHSGFEQVRRSCGMSCGQRVRLSDPSEALTREWQRMDALWCDGLSRFGGPFLAGERFTVVDAFYAPVAFRVQTYDPLLSDEARAYVTRLLALEPMRDWYEAALAEDFRDEDHEREVASSGEVLEDFRVPARQA
ncbi:MAG: glutathione S-transferase [Pseudomonadota bacterium]